MPSPKSRIAAAILKDRGAPQGTSPDEQRSGAGMDGIDRSSFPDINDITDPLTPSNGQGGYSGIQRKDGQKGTC